MKNGFQKVVRGLFRGPKGLWPLAGLLCAGLSVPDSAQAATFTVSKLADTSDGTCNADCSLREAIVAANNAAGSDVINFASALTGAIDLATPLPDLSTNIALQGLGADVLTVRRSTTGGTPAFRIFTVAGGTTASIFGLTLSNGLSDVTAFGGAIANDGQLALTACVLSDNAAIGTGNAVAGNKGNDGQGGAIFNSGTLTMLDCTISNNEAAGADSLTNGQGGVALGGAIFNNDGTLNLTGCVFNGNRTTGGDGVAGGVAQGGAIRGDGTMTLAKCTFNGNVALGGSKGDGQGGALYCSATTTLVDCNFLGNSALGTAGGVGQGGGIRNSGTLSMTASTLTGNIARGGASLDANGGSGVGGGFYNSGGTATIAGCTLGNNSASGSASGNGTGGAGLGGGIYNNNASTLTLNKSTLSENRTTGGNSSSGSAGASIGGGLFLQSGGTGSVATVVGSTLAGNSAADGGGITVSGGTATLSDTLVAANIGAPSPDARGAFSASGQYNLIGDGTGLTGLSNGLNGNQIGTAAAPIDPKLGPLQFNGGPTQTRGLLPGSPALDKGKNFGLNTDQRGQTRPYDDGAIANAAGGDGSDIGAFEAQLIQIRVNDPVAVLEGSASAPGKVTFTITLSAPSNQSVTVNYLTVNGVTNGAIAGQDYAAKSGPLTFAPGETIKRVTINFIGDSVAEQAEPFFFDLKTPVNATIADSRGVAYIRNDDGPDIVIDNAVTVNEGNSGTSAQTFTVRLSAASTNTVTVNYTTANGTAGPADYTAQSGTLSFAPGETSKLITILVKGDTQIEPTETYRVNLTSPTYAILADSQGVGYIRNDDTLGALFEDEPSQ